MERFPYVLFVLLLLSSFSMVLRGSGNEDKTKHQDDTVFKPTSDWQPLRKDQAIPRGLHVRMNLQTGEREAKLLDPEDDEDGGSQQMTEIKTSDHDHPGEYSSHDEFSKEELKRALYKMEDGFESVSDPEDVDRVRKQFRSYSELKKELGEMKLNMKTGQEIISQLVDEYKDTTDKRSGGSVERKELEAEESLLNQLEYNVHQLDNAIEFVRLNGVKDIVFPSLNSTSWKVRYEATKLLGSAVQSNPNAQISTLEAGAIPVLLRVLALDPNSKVKAGALYALSCLIRRFPLAQKQFLDRGGLTVIVKQFNSDTSGQLKIQLKAINLIRDIIDEVREADLSLLTLSPDSPERSIASERYRQQSNLNIWVRLVEEGWCQALTTLLSRHSEDVQVIELLSDGMSAVSKECYSVFKGSERTISRLTDHYQSLVANVDYDYQWIYSNLQKLLKTLHETRRDEL
uniref:Nucleotide exchange factor SIL1 n=2 Tax=Lygus hesperus TaxID=30085 RepID=A0A0A9WWZ0_LYGHE